MRLQSFLLGCACALPAMGATPPASGGAPDSSYAASSRATEPALTLQEAWALAEAANPTLRNAKAEVSAAEGQVRDTQAPLWNNPQLATDLTRRRVTPADATGRSYPGLSFGIVQTFEIAGQQGYRRKAAELGVAAIQLAIEDVRRQIRGDVELAFTRVLALQRRIGVEEEALRVVDDAAAAVRKRVQAGEDSRLEGNLSAVEVERGRNQLTILREQLLQARAELAALLQLPAGSFPAAAGRLDLQPPAYTLESLLGSAAGRPQLRALELREGAARNRLLLERAAAYPDVTLGLATGREETLDAPRERLTTFSISVPLPLFRRNATGIGRATTELTQAQIERQTASRDIEARVRALWQQLQSLTDRVKRLTDSVLPTLTENQRLSLVAFRSGEIGLLQLLLVNRQLLDARRDYLDAFSQFIEARVVLEQAAGISGAAERFPAPAAVPTK